MEAIVVHTDVQVDNISIHQLVMCRCTYTCHVLVTSHTQHSSHIHSILVTYTAYLSHMQFIRHMGRILVSYKSHYLAHVGNTMTDDFIHRSAQRLRKLVIVQR